jgi:hypothetical protein
VPVLRVLIPYTMFWIRLGYRMWHGIAYWVLRLIPMPTVWRRYLAGTAALIPYVWIVWGFTLAFEFTWRADVVAGVITAGMLLIVYRVEVARAR